MSKSIGLQELTKYVNSATELADSIRDDIKNNNNTISDTTIISLNEFIVSAVALKHLTEALPSNKMKLN